MNVNGIDLTIIDSTGIYDYSWSEFAVMRGNDGYLYVGEDSGCSCYGFGDGLDEVTKVASWQDACTKAQEWAKDYASGEERLGCMDMIERLTVLRPVAVERADA